MSDTGTLSRGPGRVSVVLSGADLTLLEAMAAAEHRTPDAQAAWLLTHALRDWQQRGPALEFK